MSEPRPLMLRIKQDRTGYEIVWGEEVMQFVSIQEAADAPSIALGQAVEKVKRRIRIRRFVENLRTTE